MDALPTSAFSWPNIDCSRADGPKATEVRRLVVIDAANVIRSTSEVPQGTRFLVELRDTLKAEKVKRGKKFDARTLEALPTADGRIIPAGAKLKGKVSYADDNKLMLRFEEIQVDGRKQPIIASVLGVVGGLHLEWVGGVDGATAHQVALGLLHRKRLAGQRRLVGEGGGAYHHAVDGDDLAGADEEAVPGLDHVDVDRLHLPVYESVGAARRSPRSTNSAQEDQRD